MFGCVAIGVDDMFVMLNVFRLTPRHEPVPVRLRRTFEDSAVSITVTTLTDGGVFAVRLFPSPSIPTSEDLSC